MESEILKIKSLAVQVQAGNTRAFNQLYTELWEPLYVHARALVMDEDKAKDILQEIWVDYWQRRNKIDTANIRAYLFRAVKYKSYNYLRDHKFNHVQLEAIHALADVVPEQDTEDHAYLFASLIEPSLERLPSRCQSIFKLSRIEGYSNDEIARLLNISKRTVENQISLAMKRLRTDLQGREWALVLFYLYML
ncbi:RNA polymerase sigma-70 factor [Sinomicrobium sp. M5D2P9]